MGFAGTLCFSFPGNLTLRHLPPQSASSLGLSQLPNVGEKCEGESVASQLYSQSAPVLVLLPLKASSPGFELGATVSFGLSVILNPVGLELGLCYHLFVPELPWPWRHRWPGQVTVILGPSLKREVRPVSEVTGTLGSSEKPFPPPETLPEWTGGSRIQLPFGFSPKCHFI